LYSPAVHDAVNVFAFDRDSTVDVNPPDDGSRAVPLAWMRYLAHETEHAVWVTGNQRLVDEAEIPGDDEAIERYRQRWGDPRKRVERRPAPNLELQVVNDPNPPDPDLTTAVHGYVTGDGRLDRHQRVSSSARCIPEPIG